VDDALLPVGPDDPVLDLEFRRSLGTEVEHPLPVFRMHEPLDIPAMV